jgi:peptidoglycan/LPS O-acetylase OafA/YrhL
MQANAGMGPRRGCGNMDRIERRLPGVDGLRAVAVVAVVLYHGFPQIVRGGYIGVDIFFVISGFVIALRYLEPMVLREIGLRTFFMRRIRRLVPAYFAMLVAATAVAASVMIPKDLINFGSSLAAQALYAQNIVFWLQGDYFDAALQKPLLHTWSLAVEEQFYLCFPLLILALRRQPRLALIACSVLSLVTLAAAVYVEQISPKTAFYWLPFRTWEFLAGIGAAALYARGAGPRVTPAVANVIGVAALIGIVVSIFGFDGEHASALTQGLLAVVSTVALCLVQARMVPAVSAVLTNPLAQHFGRISYSWYLWHWPPLVFTFLLTRQPATGPLAGALTLLGYGLGLVSWWIFEQRVSRSAWLSKPSTAAALLVAFLVFAGATGVALVTSNGFLQRYPVREQPLLLAQMDRPSGRCDFITRLEHWRNQTCPITSVEGEGGILFIGDSHVEMQKEALAALGVRYGVPVYITKQNCRIIDFGVDQNCKWKVWRGIEQDIKRQHISQVVAISLWPSPFDPRAFDQAVQRLLKTGAQIVLARPTPHDARFSPSFYLNQPFAWGQQSLYTREAENEGQRPVNMAISDQVTRNPRIQAVDPIPLLCPGQRCLFAKGDAPLYSDTHHLTKAGAYLITPIYEPVFAAAARDRLAARRRR